MHRFIRHVLLFMCLISSAFAQTNTLTGIKVVPQPDDRVRIDFQFANPLKNAPASFITQKPPRLILDFVDTDNSIDKALLTQKIGIGTLTNYNVVSVGNRVRVILDLSMAASYFDCMVGNVYSLTLNGKSNNVFQEKRQIFITNQPVKARHAIEHLNFKGTGKLQGRLILDVSDASIPIDVTRTGKEIVANFLSTRVPQPMLKRYDVADFQSPAKLMSLEQQGKDARLVIISQGDYGYYAYQVNKQFIIDIFPLSPEEAKQAKSRKEVFTGKRISLNFQKVPIRSVLQLLADFSGTNIVVNDSDKITGDITLRLNDIPWDQALDIILKNNNLAKRRNGNVIMVLPVEELLKQKEDTLTAQQKVTQKAPLRSELIQINYAQAAEIAVLLKDKTTSLLSERGTISVDPRTNNIWIKDTGAQIEVIRELIKQIDVPARQVLIEARIVEVTKDCVRDLGIRFGISKPPALSGTLRGADKMQKQLAAGKPLNTVAALVEPFTDRLNVDLAAEPVAAQAASIGIALAKLGDNILLDLELSALESEGRGEIIASPRLITINQQEAVIESGEEIPYQEATSSGATAVAFKKAVLSLKVRPLITHDNKILLDLKINQDRASPQLFNGVPAILTKELRTNVLVNNGQTIVLGGIYQKEQNNTINRVPFFGTLPVVGALFRNQSTDTRNEELLIFITPKIITSTLSITAIEGKGKPFPKGVELDKFGKPVAVYK